MSTFTLENISGITQRTLPCGGCEISFASANPGMHHQLYADSLLIDWTESSDCRRFVLPPGRQGPKVVVIAVAPGDCATDFSARLPVVAEESGAVSLSVLPPADLVNCTVFLLDDHAGMAPPSVVAAVESRRAWQGQVGMGCGRFGLDGMGFDGSNSPGFGNGDFAAGRFGFDLHSVQLMANLVEEGLHTLTAGFAFANGRTQFASEQTVLALPPPPPIQAIKLIRYDEQSKTLTLHIE